ncbi:notchless protein homolog 1-like [Clavelina lepadiformis]|uniref:notchless protein homolog 1-like n=1 Tax=Clavelina lepadiformis TaxID=159417 RepID=UPI004041ABEF
MDIDEHDVVEGSVLVQMCNEDGESTGPPLDVPLSVTAKQLQLLCNSLLENDEQTPYSFFVNDAEILSDLKSLLEKEKISTESSIQIIYQPQAVFKVRAVTRCTSSIEGHAEAVLSVKFSPNGKYLASGSGDTTVRFWDISTETPHQTCKAHRHWVLCIAWSPDGKKLASACKNGQICIWDPKTGKQQGKTMSGHKQWITYLCWQPLHLDGACRKLASSSKDATVRIWDVVTFQCIRTLSSHLQSITCIKWSGEDLIYSASQDRTIKVWRSSDGVMCRTLQGHGHWVNVLALNTDYVMRTGAFDPASATLVAKDNYDNAKVLQEKALKRYESVKVGSERMVSGSDDFTLFLWNPSEEKKHLARMTGHQALVNDVRFSPDTRLIASASFDKSVKLWDGKNGKFLASLRGHVGAVYQVSWSADSRLLVSGSGDSTLKVWDAHTRKLLLDLPGHADEVYAVDWSTDGQRVVSGGKDKVLKIWRR